MHFNRYDICEAYYLFLSQYHEGQNSENYERLSRMTRYFKPSPILSFARLSENAQEIYLNLLVEELK